jgi:hypothetical protein
LFPTRSAEPLEQQQENTPSPEITPRAATSHGGGTDSRELLLRAPSEVDAETSVIRAFFLAVRDHDLDGLRGQLAPNAKFGRDTSSQTRDALAVWSERLKKLDYRRLGPSLPYAESRLEIYSATQLKALGREQRFGLSPAEGELLVRVEIKRSHAGGQRLFADELLLLLRPRASGYQIAQILEDFQLP